MSDRGDRRDSVGCVMGSVLLDLCVEAARRWAEGDEVGAARLWAGAVRLRGRLEFVDGLPATAPDDGREAQR